MARDPFLLSDVEAILAAAKAMPGDVSGIPSGRWWSALVLVLLDCPVQVGRVFELPRSAYHHGTGTLHVKSTPWELHPLVVEAIDAIRRHQRQRLFPWPLDGGKVGNMLLRRFGELLFRANLPHVRSNKFERLRITAKEIPDVLDRIDPHRPVELRSRAPKVDRGERADHAAIRRERNRAQAARAEVEIYPIGDSSERSLRNFFRAEYEPRRLANAAASTPQGFLAAITRLGAFLGCEPCLDQLSDELLERFAAWDGRTRSPSTVGGHLTHLRALWRFAWRRRFVDEAPRDNSKPKQDRRIPEAWSIDEMGRILDFAETAEGWIGNVPAGVFWMAFVSLLYETGLRVGAALALEASAFEPGTRWLTVPATVQKQRSDQVFRLSDETTGRLAKLPSDGALFPVPWRAPVDQLRKRYRRILEAAGLPTTDRDMFHKIRRTHATVVADVFDEHEAQRQLGHSSVQLTRNNYIDPRKLRTRVHATDQLPELPRGKTG